MLYAKDEATDFNTRIDNTDEFKPYKHRDKLLGKNKANVTYGSLRITTVTVPLNYLNNFKRSLEMLLINSKVELKLRWTKHCVLLVLGVTSSVAL